MWKEFKEFIMRGSVVDLAVGIVIGAAFAPIAKSLVDDIIMPPIGLLLGGVEFDNLFLILKQGAPEGPYSTLAAAQEAGAVTISYGLFVNAVLTFCVVAFAVFLLIKAINRMRRADEGAAPEDPTTRKCPHCLMDIPFMATRCAHCTAELAAA